MKIKISTDSTCDLPAELIAAHDIGVQPLYIIRGGEALRDGIDVTPDDLYAYTKETGKLCGTSAVTITDYLGSWKAWLEEYDAIVPWRFPRSCRPAATTRGWRRWSCRARSG